MFRATLVAVLSLLAVADMPAASAQDFTGSYAFAPPGGTAITLILRQTHAGQITGTLTGNTVFDVQAQVRNGQLVGYASTPNGRLYIEGQFQGPDLQMAMAEVGPDGRPLVQTARTVMFARTDGTGQAEPAPAGGLLLGRAPAGPSTGTGSGVDPYAGTFVGPELSLTLSRAGTGYTGLASHQGVRYPVQVQMAGGQLMGTYQVDGVPHPFQAMLQGDAMTFRAGDQTFLLQRQTGATPGAGAAGSPSGPVGGSPQDQQIAQLLLRSAWCAFSFTGVSGTTYGRSSTERVVFRADGSGFRRTGGESYSSGPYGSAAGQHAGGEPSRWQVRGGALNLTSDNITWETIPLMITQNSSGWPIVKAAGKEYSMCN